MAGSGSQKQDAQPAYVLHAYPYRETSLVAEVFTRDFGRLGLVARGARRSKSAMRGLMMPFQPLLLSWAGRSELRTLHKAEWQGGVPQLKGANLMCGFYLNELLLKFMARDDPHEHLYATYHEAVLALSREAPAESTLRRFEKNLLKEMGYGLPLEREAETGQPIDPRKRYAYAIERGPLALHGPSEDRLEIEGRALIDLACDNFEDPATLTQIKLLMRFLLNHYLENQELHTRQLLRELNQL
jgi:DNA repair protein RecO (recombination protein O)